jgi:hypothetical protein
VRASAWPWAWLVVGVAVVVAGLVRGSLVGATLPYVHHPDEPHNVKIAQRMAADGEANPREFLYPALMFDVEAAVMTATHDDVIVTQTPGNSLALRPQVVVLLRWLVGVLPGLVAVAAAGASGWVAARRWWAAGLAAGLLALNPLELRFGPLITPDALAGAASGLAVLGAVCVLARPTMPRYLLAGAAIGLAASAKYNAALVAVPLVVAHGLVLVRTERTGRGVRGWLGWREWRGLVVAAVASAAVFLLFNPFAVLDTEGFVQGLRRESHHYRTGHPGSEGGALGYHLSWLRQGFGPALLLTPLGLAARDRRVREAALVALGFAVVYVGFISSFEVRFARNLLPVTVAVAAAAALGAVAVIEWIAAARRARSVGAGVVGGVVVAAIASVCVVAILAWPAGRTRTAFGSLTDDHWKPAQRWLDAHVPPGSRVAVGAYGIYVDPDRYQVTAVPALISHDAAWYRDQGFTLVVASEQHFHRLLADPERFPDKAAAYQALLDETCVLHATGPPDARVLLLSPRPC